MTKLHQQAAGGPQATSCGQQAGGFGGRTGPTVEEHSAAGLTVIACPPVPRFSAKDRCSLLPEVEILAVKNANNICISNG
uniref:Uncharacterized protein n=1 Tax=Anopheles albimanus TaxID=7167 RepID=A0A182FAK8_ANOAL